MTTKLTQPEIKRIYRSSARKRQAEDTRERISKAALALLKEKHYDGMTIDGIAARAEVSPQTVFAIFGSKAGVLSALVDQTSFGPVYQRLVAEAMEMDHPADRLRHVAKIACHIYQQRTETIDILQGARLVSNDLAKLIQKREALRYVNQKFIVDHILEKSCLREDLAFGEARDVLWALTSRELYGLLVQERRWSASRYEQWLGTALVIELLRPSDQRLSKTRSRKPV